MSDNFSLIMGVLATVVCGIGFIAWYVADGIYEKRERAKRLHLFSPLIGGDLQTVGGRFFRYRFEGTYSGRAVRLEAMPFNLFRRKLTVSLLSVQLRHFEYRGWKTPFVEDGNKKYNFIGDLLSLCGKQLAELNGSAQLPESVAQQLGIMCGLADRIDDERLTCEFLIRK